jgi:hypothetical protein
MTLGNASLNALERIATAVEDGVEIQVGEAVGITPGTYLGDQVIAGNSANQNATLPTGTKTVWVMAEGGPVYCEINGVAAVATAGIYVPENNVRLVGPFSNLTSLGVYAATGDTARLVYEG